VVSDYCEAFAARRLSKMSNAEQLRYRPSVAARAMVNRRSGNLGLIAAGTADYGRADAGDLHSPRSYEG
jgi:hypothetical protein